MEMVETALILMNEYIQDNLDYMHKEWFTDTVFSEVRQVLEAQFNKIEDQVLSTAFILLKNGRISYRCPVMNDVDIRIEKIRNKPQPVQRTVEWYEYRHKLITASAAYKALGSDAKVRELVRSKKEPCVIHSNTCVDGPMHWGVKYEPVSVSYYEWVNKTIVEEFGCITHDTHCFLGASPDGINVLETSPLYGRMLEVKNPFTREITGNPKEEYWIQCQVQMEVCDLNACDFLETKFVEYETEEAFYADGSFQSVNGKCKGIILQFFTDKVVYEYAPFQCTEEEYKEWEKTQMNERSWIRTIYWKLEDVSCVLILRQPKWFELMLPVFQSVNAKIGIM
jgi:putative phage-type endonuclease